MQIKCLVRSITLVVVLSVIYSSTRGSAQDARQNPKVKPQLKKGANDTASSCENLPKLVEVCGKPLLDIIQGQMEKWPVNEKETQELCDSFITTERCIRDVGRKCAKGLQKTIISTLATAIGRSRKRECTKDKLPAVLKMTQCVEKSQAPMHIMMANITGHLLTIDGQFRNVDSKTNAVCCMVHSIEADIKQLYSARCPNEGALIIRMYRAVLEDVIELICRTPKCNDIFKGYKIPKTKQFDGIISILLRIVFSLGE